MSTSEGKGTAPMRMPAIRNSLMAYGHHQEFVQKDVMYLNRSTEELAKEDMFVRPVAESNTPSLETKLVYVDEEIVKLAWDVVCSTGTLPEWEQWLEPDMLFMFSKPVGQVSQNSTYVGPQVQWKFMRIGQNDDGKSLWGAQTQPWGPAKKGNTDVVGFLYKGSKITPLIRTDLVQQRSEENLLNLRNYLAVVDHNHDHNEHRIVEKAIREEKSLADMEMNIIPVISAWSEEMNLLIPIPEKYMPKVEGANPDSFLRSFLVAILALSRQPLIVDRTDATDGQPAKPAKRKQHKRIPLEELKKISVLRLRRIQPNHEDEGTKDTESRAYSHRWIVSGHFRNQAVGQNWSEHRVIWIPPYVVGPAGKPLVIKEKVTVIR